jgi:hypothetical protein
MRALGLLTLVMVGCPQPQTPAAPTPPTCAWSVEVSAPSLEVAVGQRQRVVVTFRNPSPTPVLISQLALRDGAPFSLLVAVEQQPIRAGTCEEPGVLELPIEFAPTTPGPRNAVLTGLFGESAFSMPLRGFGVGPTLDVVDQLSLGLVALGEATARPLQLRNVGTVNTSLEVEVLRVVPGNAATRVDELCLGRWNGSSCESPKVTVEQVSGLPILILATSAGAREWLVTLRSSEFGRPEKQVRIAAVLLDTTGCHLVANQPVVEFTPPMEFKAIRLTNQGTGDCLIDSVETTNAAFRLSQRVGPRTRVAPRQALDLSLVGVLARVQDPLEGELIGTLLGGNPPPLKVPLRFRVGAVSSCLSFGAAELDAGLWLAGCRVGAREFLARNECPAPVVVQEVRVTGGYEALPVMPSGIVAPGSAFPIRVIARPSAGVGFVTGSLELRGAGGAVSVGVRGLAVERRARTETFSIGAPSVDLLFVLDDSPSFGVHHARTAANLSSIAQRLSSSFMDVRVGVTTTTEGPEGGRLRTLSSGARWTTRWDPDFVSAFATLAAMQDGGSEDESCLEAAIRARTATDGGSGFWRPDTVGAVVCVTDADENLVDLDGGIARLRDTASDLRRFSYSVVSGRTSSACGVESQGARHDPVWTSFHGVNGDICDSNWWAAFFGLSGGPFPQTSFSPSQLPDVGAATPSVTIDGVPVPARASDGGTLWSLSNDGRLMVDVSLVNGPTRTLSFTYVPACP